MEKLKQSAVLTLSKREGRGIVEQLRRREFIDQMKRAKERSENRWGIRNSELPEAVFSKDMEDGEISVMLLSPVEAAALMRMHSGAPDATQLRMRARFCYSNDRKLALFVEAHPEKSHCMPAYWTDSQMSGYAADIVPCHDVSRIVARCIALHQALRGVLADARVDDALNVLEVIEKLGGALKAISNENPHKKGTSAYMEPLLGRARERLARADEFLRTDAGILEALEDVADKED